MDIQTEAQAAKVRAVMRAMIGKIQEAKEAGDKAAWQDLKVQYTTLQNALQEYKAKEVPEGEAAAADNTETVAQLRKQLEEAQATIKEQRHTIGALKYEMEILRDEVRTLRAPPPVQEFDKVRLIPPSQSNNTEIDWAKEIAAITGQNT